jgi:hypothetical protein
MGVHDALFESAWPASERKPVRGHDLALDIEDVNGHAGRLHGRSELTAHVGHTT